MFGLAHLRLSVPEGRLARIGCVDLYGQEPEVRLLSSFLPHLDHRSVIDVGAERGAFVDELLRAGSEIVHAIDPEPGNAAFLRRHFSKDVRVTVHECAASNVDGELQLHTSVGSDGAPLTFGHTVLERPATPEIAWDGVVTVPARSLASLVETGEIPTRVGIVKVDTEGYDFAVVSGMGDLECDIVMTEHWSDLPRSLGVCPWTAEEMLSELRPRGFSHFAYIAHREEFVILQWDDGEVPRGSMGNLVFLHARVLERLLPATLELASSLAKSAVVVGEMYAGAARERLAVIGELERSRLLGE